MITIPIFTFGDMIMAGLIIFAIDIISPPWPSSELIILLPLRFYCNVSFLIGEIISQSLAVIIIVYAYLQYNSIITEMLKIGFSFVFTFWGFVLTVIGLVGLYIAIRYF